MKIGVIADTQRKMRPEALDVLKGSDLILHAGDVGRDDVLEALEALTPLVAIRGNIDKTGRAADLPDMIKPAENSCFPSNQRSPGLRSKAADYAGIRISATAYDPSHPFLMRERCTTTAPYILVVFRLLTSIDV